MSTENWSTTTLIISIPDCMNITACNYNPDAIEGDDRDPEAIFCGIYYICMI